MAATEFEEKVVSLNRKAMEQLAKEDIHGYGMIDESQWEMHMKK